MSYISYYDAHNCIKTKQIFLKLVLRTFMALELKNLNTSKLAVLQNIKAASVDIKLK